MSSTNNEILLIQNAQEFRENLFTELKQQIQNNLNNKYLTRLEVAKLFKVSKSSVYNWTRKGILNTYQIGGRVFYKLEEVEDALVKLKN